MSTSAASGSTIASSSQNVSSWQDLMKSPLQLPSQFSKNTFYLSPAANPDLVLALVIPGHPLYSGHNLPHTASESSKPADDKKHGSIGSTLSHFFGSAANTVTNTAASTIGVKNQLELNKPKLKLVPRGIIGPGVDPKRYLNQRWMLSKEDGCVYSCVEEKDGGEGSTFYRLGSRKNQMVRVRSKNVSLGGEVSRIGVAPGSSNQAPGVLGRAGSIVHDPSSQTRHNSVTSRSGSTMDLNSANSSSSSSSVSASNPGIISVTTATGQTVVCPLKWEADKNPIKGEQIKESIAINGVQVVIEDLESPAQSSGGITGALSRAVSIESSKSGSGNGSGSGGAARDSSKLLTITNICCGNLECELEKIDVGSSCGFKREQDAGVSTFNEAGAGATPNPATPKSSTSDSSNGSSERGLTLKQIWRIESDFSMWLSTLSRSVSTEYNLTRKLQKIEMDRLRIRNETPDPEPHIPFKLTIDFEYQQLWSTESTKASNECSIYRPIFPANSQYAYLGDFAHGSVKPPGKKDSIVISPAANGQLHKGLVRPVDFELVWKKEKGKMGNLYVWNPLAPVGVDAVALGHVVTVGKKEEKPSVATGIVLVLREYLRDTGLSLSTPVWIDANLGGGAIGGLWQPKNLSTFFCNPNSHQPPLGSYYTLLDPSDVAEKCPLLRPMEVMNSRWESVWDDKGTLASMDVSVWRPSVEKAFVRFGDLIVRGHEAPTSLPIVAKDHPAFRRPKEFKLLTKFYRGARKCYVFQPIPCDDNYVALGFVVSPNKEEPPLVDSIRVVHKEALMPLGVLRQMWIEHHNGLAATLTLGMTNFINLSKEGAVNMLWKNRSLGTFSVMQNTHARPSGPVYRLTMTAKELESTIVRLEEHARWVLESFYTALDTLQKVLVESEYKRLSMSPQQVATIFQAIKGIFCYLREADGDNSAFHLTESFAAYLNQFETERLKAIYSHFKRYLYQNICAEIADRDTTLETLDDSWLLLKQMNEVHKVLDKVDEWTPKLTGRFTGGQTKSLISLIMDEHIGREIFERFLEKFPPRVGIGLDAGDVDEEEDDEAENSKSASSSGQTPSDFASPKLGNGDGSPEFKRLPSLGSSEEAEASKQQAADVKEFLDKLSEFSAELDAVVGITDQMEIRKLYLEYYQNYLTHTLQTEFPVKGCTARHALTRHKLGMSSLLAIVSWISSYIEMVEQDLLEGDREEARGVLLKMEDLVDRFMDAHDEHAKEKMLNWIGNILRQEERAPVELLDGADEDTKKNKYYFTSGPSDLFNNINMLFDSQSANLSGRPLARIALMYVHVLSYYQTVQGQYYRALRAVKDETTFETVKGKTPIPTLKHGGSLDKPYSFLLAQINNSRLYQANVDELGEKVLHRLQDDVSDEVCTSLEDSFSQCSEEFQTLALGATEVLIRHIAYRLSEPLSKCFTASVWYADAEYFQGAVIDELDELCSFFIPNIEASIYATHLLRESAKGLIRVYLKNFVANCKNQLNGTMTITHVAERMRDDRAAMREYALSIKKWNIVETVDKLLPMIDTVIDFLQADVDFLKLNVSELAKVFRDDREFTPAIITNYLLSLRSDVDAEDKKMWLAPYANELKAIEEAKKAAAHAAATNKLTHILGSNKPTVNASQISAAATALNSSSALGTQAYGLEIILIRGTDLAVKDTTTSDPYVNILLLDVNAARINKQASRTIDKTLNPIWNETFSKYAPSEVSLLNVIRFEVWDKDFLSKDFMGWAEVSVEEIRNKQLLARKASVVGRNNSNDDSTQEPINFHLKLNPLPGKQNKGDDFVSGFIDVRIRYFKLAEKGASASGATNKVAPAAAGAGKGAAPPKQDEDDLFDGVEDSGQTGSKRPAPGGAAASSSSSLAPPQEEEEQHVDAGRSSDLILGAIQTSSGGVWSNIVSTMKLGRTSKLPPADGNASATPGASASTIAVSKSPKAAEAAAAAEKKKKKKGLEQFDVFGLF